MSLADQIAQAIAQMEGFNTPGSIAQRNNNPGNLRSWGSMPTASGYAQFPTPAAGWQALTSQVTTNINRGLNLYEFFGGQRDAAGNVIPGGYPGYSPSADQNHPIQYAQFVSQRIGIDPTVPLNGASPPFQKPRPSHKDQGYIRAYRLMIQETVYNRLLSLATFHRDSFWRF